MPRLRSAGPLEQDTALHRSQLPRPIKTKTKTKTKIKINTKTKTKTKTKIKTEIKTKETVQGPSNRT
ncbi:hypothetical protein HRG_013042 [Hirsutella rhossiliensis]